jgi:hypothetical protein
MNPAVVFMEVAIDLNDYKSAELGVKWEHGRHTHCVLQSKNFERNCGLKRRLAMKGITKNDFLLIIQFFKILFTSSSVVVNFILHI